MELRGLSHRPFIEQYPHRQRSQRRGWKWTPYGCGFRRPGTAHKVTSEEEVFRFVNLPFLPPWERR